MTSLGDIDFVVYNYGTTALLLIDTDLTRDGAVL